MGARMLSAGDGPASTWNVPNLITIVRILCVPVFLWLLLADNGAHGPLRWWAGALFVAGIATDALDGHLARSRNLITDLGKLLDPVADKALTGAAFIGLSVLGELPWWVTIAILVREVGITIWRLIEARRIVMPAGRGGKVKTVIQAVALAVALLPLAGIIGAEPWRWVNIVLMSSAFVLTIWSGLEYLWRAYRPGRGAVEAADGAAVNPPPPFDDPEHP